MSVTFNAYACHTEAVNSARKQVNDVLGTVAPKLVGSQLPDHFYLEAQRLIEASDVKGFKTLISKLV